MKCAVRFLCASLITLSGNILFLLNFRVNTFVILLLIFLFCMVNVFPSFINKRMPLKRYRICADGCELLILFLISTPLSILCMFAILPFVVSNRFWNGIIRVYCSPAQIGLKWRIIGIICAWMPIINLIVLAHIIRIAYEESRFESQQHRLLTVPRNLPHGSYRL